LIREVLLSELELLNLESSLKKLVGLLTSDSDAHSDFLISLDTEASDGVLSLGLDRLLISEILKYLSGLGKSITALSDAAVDDELLNLDLSHLVLELFLLLLLTLHHIF
jgi:hypothetical protein